MDLSIINKNAIKIIEVLKRKLYFNEIYEKTGIKSKNNLVKNLNLLTKNKFLIKEQNRSNTYYSLNYSNLALISLINITNLAKFDKLPFNIKKSTIEVILECKPIMAILFGSYAKENYKAQSDIDLLFIDAKTENKEKIKEISNNYGTKINVVFMKSEELNLRSESLMHIFKTGYPLTGENYFYNEIEKEI